MGLGAADSDSVPSVVGADAEVIGHFRPGRQLVGRGAGRGETTLVVPEQLLERQPSRALDEAAFDLSAIDHGRQRIADVLQDVDAPQAVVAGEAVDLHFGDGGAEGEVVKRRAAAGRAIEVNLRRPVIALREERDSLQELYGSLGHERILRFFARRLYAAGQFLDLALGFVEAVAAELVELLAPL